MTAGLLFAVTANPQTVHATEESPALQPAKVEARAEELYQDGIEFFKAHRYEEARDHFRDVERLKKAYKSTWTYLKRSEELLDYNNELALENERREWAKQKEQYERDLKMQKRLMEEQKHRIISREPVLSASAAMEPAVDSKELARLKQEKQKADKLAAARERREEKQRIREEKRMVRLQAIEEARERKAAVKEEKRLAKLRKREEAIQRKEQAAREKEETAARKQLARVQAVEASAEPDEDELLRKRKEELERKLRKGARRQQALSREESQLTRRQQKDKEKAEMYDVTTAYKQAVKLNRSDRFVSAREKIAKARDMLAGEYLSDAYRRKMGVRLDALEKAVDKRSMREKEREAVLAEKEQRREERLAQKKEAHRETAAEKAQRQKEVRLRKKEIEAQRRRDRAVADLEKKRREYKQGIERALVLQEKKVDDNLDKSRKLIALHREEVKKDQAQIKKEFQTGLEALYKDAVELYNSGALRTADDVFSEIERLEPDYKLTRRYQDMINLSLGRDQDRPARGLVSSRQRRQVIAETLDAFDLE